MIRSILIAAAIVVLARCGNAPPQSSVFGASQVQSTSSSPPTVRVVDVPGPIGVLGVVAAFGWSRRLRRRVKAAQSLTTKP